MILFDMGENGSNPNISNSLIEDWLRSIIREELERVVKGISTEPKFDETYLSIDEVAKKLSVNRSTLDRWTKNGLLLRYKVGGRRLYKKSEIEKFVDED